VPKRARIGCGIGAFDMGSPFAVNLDGGRGCQRTVLAEHVRLLGSSPSSL
jgi:hypothetical protein